MTNTSENDLIKTPVFKSVLRDLYKKQKRLGKESKNINKITIDLGEVDHSLVQERKKILDYLKKIEVVSKYKVIKTTDIVAENDDSIDAFLEAECEIAVMVFEEYLKKISLIPRFIIDIKSDRSVVLNDTYVIAKPNFMSENEEVFSFLYKHPNKEVKKAVIEKAIKSALGKALRQTVRDLQFKGELRKVFFPDVSQNGVRFRNNVYQKEVEALQINERKLKEELSGLKKWKKK